MRLIFHADASLEIGAGHVMRISTLAKAAIERGYECHFIGQVASLKWVRNYIKTLGFNSISESPLQIPSDPQNCILVFDSYTLAEEADCLLSVNWKLIVNICDSFTPIYNSDLFIFQDLIAPNQQINGPKVFGGPDFILIRESIVKSQNYEDEGGKLKIVISAGGTDQYFVARNILNELNKLNLGLNIHVFADYSIPEFSALSIKQYSNGLELDRVAADAHLAITTASTSSLEFIAREIPTLVIRVTSNQQSNYDTLSELGFVLPIGSRDDKNFWSIDIESLRKAVTDRAVRDSLRRGVRGLIDGKGNSRILDLIEKRIAG
jgi:spore coat polysaccharide biosynthesis predicted glycosyltransferase SpsG